MTNLETNKPQSERFLQLESFVINQTQVTIQPCSAEIPPDSHRNPHFRTDYIITLISTSDDYKVGEVVLQNQSLPQRKALGYIIRADLRQSMAPTSVLKKLKLL